ncbi:MAG TPA: aspartyl protease family protein [Vicinamibacterales bacterium]|nr:aspartyl protease family protein [Vicinamibacterales bacterium]
MAKSLRCAVAAVITVACSFFVIAHAGALSNADAELQFQLGTLLFDETRYWEALQAFDRATEAQDPALALRALKGKVRSELRVAEFARARSDAERLKAAGSDDAEALSLYGDSLWAAGLFDEADSAYRDALALSPESARARFGHARSLSTRNHLQEALDEALAASATAPRDGEIHAQIGEIYERLHRFDEAATAYTNYINLLPNKDRSDKAAWSRAQVQFLEAFHGVTPVDIDQRELDALHTIPFKLVKDKIIVQARVNGGPMQDFVLDTGSEETVISRQTAERQRVKAVTYTLSAGVGEVGLRGLELARINELDFGTLQVRNLPVLIKNPALHGIPKREGESFSPLSLGMSMMIDYQKRMLTMGRTLPMGAPDFTLPMRIHRLALVRGTINSQHPTYFVVDTGGEVISISSETANSLAMQPPTRKIQLKVWGTSGWDRDAFLMPGVDLDFDRIEYRNFPLVVLNLRAPSVLLGFQLGGIVGHRFLGNYKVAMDLANSELRLEKF